MSKTIAFSHYGNNGNDELEVYIIAHKVMSNNGSFHIGPGNALITELPGNLLFLLYIGVACADC